jgi:hypothetical protein
VQETEIENEKEKAALKAKAKALFDTLGLSAPPRGAGAQFTCFTGTKVQILTL